MKQTNITTPAFAKAYWITMRPYLFFVSGISGLAGMALGQIEDLLTLLPLFIAFFFSYGFGQALTDCTQLDTDSISSPYRPMVKGIISPKDVYLVSLVGLLICGAIFTWYQPTNLGLSLLAIAGLATYTIFKRQWWGGPFYNAWIVLVLGIMGANSTEGLIVTQNLILTMVAIFFGYANFVVSGYFKDVEADRTTGYITVIVKFGRIAAAWISLGFGLLTVIPAAIVVYKNPSISSLILLGSGLITTMISQVMLFKNRKDEEAYLPIAMGVHGYILSLSAIISALKPIWSLFLIGFYALFCFTMICRPSQSQI